MGKTNFLYNPGRKDKKQLIEEFVIRQDLFQLIMEDLLTSPMTTPEQHYLLVGQRGTGKTTLLHRIRYAIEDAPELKYWQIPVIFSEEQYNIGELANLWENIGQILEDYHGFDGLYGEMEKNISASGYDERCWELLESALDKKGMKIVLLIDNIGDLLKKLKDLEVRRLRRILQTKPQLRLIAASPLYLESILDYTQPLFEFFKVLRLEDLDAKETCELLLKLADIHEEREKIERIIKETPERIETLRTLTGGVPRTIALMFNIFIEYEQEGSLEDLERILDIVTPLYKHRMDDLPPQQQKIVDAVAKYWDPISVKILKERVRLESKVISAQLRQLEKDQVIQKLETSTKNNEYILKERFFNIWYLMRYGRKDDKQRVIWLVRFLESWCTDEEIARRVSHFIDAVKNNKLDDNVADFLSEVYSSLKNLDTESKFLVKEELSGYGQSIKFSDEEIEIKVKECFLEGNYLQGIKFMAHAPRFSDKYKKLLYENIHQIIDDKDKIFEMPGVFYNKLNITSNKNSNENIMRQIILFLLLVLAAIQISRVMRSRELEADLEWGMKFLPLFAIMIKSFGKILSFEKLNYETLILLAVIKQFYSIGLIYPLLEVFEKEELSEIFNPIYLALKSLEPGAKSINIAPEKEEIVRQVRDLITAPEGEITTK